MEWMYMYIGTAFMWATFASKKCRYYNPWRGDEWKAAVAFLLNFILCPFCIWYAVYCNKEEWEATEDHRKKRDES